ncbi:hypothetical protein Clacol_003673 [Clathrus columnatus]|uniref:HIT domain-containing protein n=1 Tax=Clathrus columnatus TaxID=1419009 RepID=A0AAV5A583_9AGAM|nr:hypothetical protein Clacol_003673 [Clathrus columnatus]
MSMFTPKPGCPMCSIARAASLEPITNFFPNSNAKTGKPEILWRDDNFTAYLEKENPVSSKGHIVILFNLHVPSIYSLSSSDLPLLSVIQRRAKQLLHMIHPPQNSQSELYSPSSPNITTAADTSLSLSESFNIGFITPPFKDHKIPVTDHLHAHAYIGQTDLAGWWRRISYSHVAWYAIDDLIAEIRESTSNNRVKSGYSNRGQAPIDSVPDAGARAGKPDGIEITPPSLAVDDIENGQPLSPTPRSPRLSSP